MDAIIIRHSCRNFYNDKIIDKKTICKILEAGVHAPSGKNLQPWKFVIVDNKKKINEISGLCTYSRFICNASSLILVYLDKNRSYCYKKDVMAIGACIENMLLAACEQGISSCWIGEIIDKENEIREMLKIMPQRELMAVIALGIEKAFFAGKISKAGSKRVEEKIELWYY